MSKPRETLASHMAESERASVQPDYVQDDTLWQQCGFDPALYVLALRRQGRRTPPWGAGIKTHNLQLPTDIPKVLP